MRSSETTDVALEAALAVPAVVDVREVRVLACKFPGCTNVATRSDGKCTRHSDYRLLPAHVVEEVQEKLKSFTPEAADLVMEAARNGALEGDHKAAAWILTHSGVVKPVAPEPRGSGGTDRLIVQVGIILPGLPGAEE